MSRYVLHVPFDAPDRDLAVYRALGVLNRCATQAFRLAMTEGDPSLSDSDDAEVPLTGPRPPAPDPAQDPDLASPPKVTRCRSCGTGVIWTTGDRRQRVPLSATPSPAGTHRLIVDAAGRASSERVTRDLQGRTVLYLPHVCSPRRRYPSRPPAGGS